MIALYKVTTNAKPLEEKLFIVEGILSQGHALQVQALIDKNPSIKNVQFRSAVEKVVRLTVADLAKEF